MTSCPLNDLLKCDVYWFWGPEQEAAFAKVKDLISTSPVLAYFDTTKITIVSADASSYGLAGVLLQYHGKELRPVAFASRTLSQAEKGYAQIEKECLAGVWCCEKLDKYLRGLDFKLFTDHKPLVQLREDVKIYWLQPPYSAAGFSNCYMLQHFGCSQPL